MFCYILHLYFLCISFVSPLYFACISSVFPLYFLCISFIFLQRDNIIPGAAKQARKVFPVQKVRSPFRSGRTRKRILPFKRILFVQNNSFPFKEFFLVQRVFRPKPAGFAKEPFRSKRTFWFKSVTSKSPNIQKIRRASRAGLLHFLCVFAVFWHRIP